MSEPFVSTAAPSPSSAAGTRPRPWPLEVTSLGMGYGDVEVLRDISVRLEPGESLRVQGGNGAGKSTLLRGLAGVQPLRAGRVCVVGHDLAEAPVQAKRCIGWSSGEVPFPYLTGREHLHLVARVHGLDSRAAADLLTRFPDWAAVRDLDSTVRTWSHGMRQQLALLMALLPDPVLLLLDEAVDGFDEQSLQEAAAHFARRSDQGRVIAYVAHRDDVARRFPRARELRVTRPTK